MFSRPRPRILQTMWDFKLKSFLDGLKDHQEKPLAVRKNCAIPGCAELGEYRAPKSRYDLRDYYWFCLEHVREYNAKWDYFKGMSPGEIEHHIHKTTVWDRPTWRMTEAGVNEERTREKIYETFSRGESVFGDFSFGVEDETGNQQSAHINVGALPHPTVEALGVLGLQPPIDWEQVKARYKSLAKKHHPDTNRGDKTAEEELKKINLAYTILKLSYQHYTKLDEK